MIRCSGFNGPRALPKNLAGRLGAVQRAQGPALHFQPSSGADELPAIRQHNTKSGLKFVARPAEGTSRMLRQLSG